MVFIVSILVSLALTVPIVGVLGKQARDVVIQFNLRQISKVLEIYYVEDGKYPNSLEEVVKKGEVKNINLGDYKYLAAGGGQRAAVLGAKSYCWRSEEGKVSEAASASLCLP